MLHEKMTVRDGDEVEVLRCQEVAVVNDDDAECRTGRAYHARQRAR